MAKKRLERTVIEGGRSGYNKWERDHSHRIERANARAYLSDVRRDPELALAASPEPRPKVHKGFKDKLGVADRWMRKRIGRPWREVEGEVLRTFDTRSLAGRHIVFDHMLPGRWRQPREGWHVGRTRFVVDDEGVLRELTYPRREPTRWWWGEPPMPPWLEGWLAGRKVGLRGERAYWLEPTGQERMDGTPFYRQGRELAPADRETLGRVPEENRPRVVVALD